METGTPAGTLAAAVDETLRRAIKDRDLRTADVLRMIKSRLLERRTAKGFSGELDDDLVREVIGAYRKQLQKALAEYGKVGERGREPAEALRFEIGVCERFLPAGLDEAATETLVRERLGTLGLSDPRQVGRLIGDVMRTHKGQVDAATVKRIAEGLLAAGRAEAGPPG